jgi:hypothetical protein
MILGAVMALALPAHAGEANDVDRATGWLLPGSASFGFRHRIIPTDKTNPILERSFRGEFLLAFRKPIYTGTASVTELIFVTQIPYAGFDEGGKKIILPLATFRVELGYRHRLNVEGLSLRAGLLHFSSHLMDPVKVEGFSDFVAASRLTLNVEALNLLRLGVILERNQNHTFINDFSGEAGFQPIRISYFLFTEANQAFSRTSYEPYDHRLYLRCLAGKRFGGQRLALVLDGEAEKKIRGSIELRWSTNLHPKKPDEDGFQMALAYDGGIGPDEIATTPWSGTTRGNWLTLGFKVSM